MPFFSWQSIDATAEQVAQALTDAAAAVGPVPGEATLLPGPQDGARAQALGGGAWVGMARWTDPLGRKHRYLEAASAAPKSRDHRFPNGTPPPGPAETAALRVISPWRVMLKNGTDLVAGCDCGVVGSPEALCWMGDCCGPCHDAALEGTARPPARALRAHQSEVTGLALLPGGRVLSGAWREPQLCLWRPKTGRRTLLTPEAVMDGVHGIVVSPSGRTAISGHHRRHLIWWDLVSREESDRLRHHDDIHALVLSPDGERLAVSGDHVPYLIDLQTLRSTPGDQDLSDLAFGHDGTLYATNIGSESIVGVDLENDETFDTGLGLGGGEEEGVWVSAFVASPTEDLVAVAEYIPRRLRLGNPKTGQWAHTLAPPEADVASLAFSPDGKTLAAGDNGGQVTLWDVASGRLLLRLQALGFRVGELAFSRGGKTLAVGDDQGMIRLWPWRRLARE
jgi:hypothetical protein